MPSRRAVLGVAGTAALAGLSGCTETIRGVVDDDRRPYARWLHAPDAVLPADRNAFATLDLSAARTDADSLPDGADDLLARLDRESDAISTADVDRLTALGYGSLPRIGVTVAATGRFDPVAVRKELSPTTGGVDDLGSYRGHDRYAYAPGFLSDLDRFAADGERPDVSFALGVSRSSLVGGVLLAPEVRARAAVRASLDARAGADTRYAETSSGVSDALAVVGDRAFALGCSEGAVAALRARLPAERETLRSVMADCRALGVGVSLPGTVLTLALSYEPADVVSLETVRRLVEEATDGENAPTVRSVSVVRRGRVVRVNLDADLDRALRAYREASLDLGALFGGRKPRSERRSETPISTRTVETALRPGRVSLLEVGVAVLDEGGHPLRLVGGTEQAAPEPTLVGQPRREVRLVDLVQRLLGRGEGELRLLGEVRCQRGDPVVQLVVGDHLADEAVLVGVLRVDALGEKYQPAGHLVADDAGQPLGPAPAGNDTEVDLRLADDGVLGGDPQVAGQREFTPAAEGVAVDRGDDRRGERLYVVHHALAEFGVRLRLLDRHLGHALDVRARDERVVPGARDDEHAGLPALCLGERARHVGQCLFVQGVEAVGAVDGQRRDVIVPL